MVRYHSQVFFRRADRNNRSNRNNRKYGNVAIKREQRLLADFAEHKQRKDCEAGLIMGIMGMLRLSEGRGCLQTMPNMSNEKTAKQD